MDANSPALILQQFSFLGDSGNQGMAICNSSGIRETNTYSLGFGFEVWGQLGEYFVSNINSENFQNSCFAGELGE